MHDQIKHSAYHLIVVIVIQPRKRLQCWSLFDESGLRNDIINGWLQKRMQESVSERRALRFLKLPERYTPLNPDRSRLLLLIFCMSSHITNSDLSPVETALCGGLAGMIAR